MPLILALTAPEWAEIAAAFFTMVAGVAAAISVVVLVRERVAASRPALYVEVASVMPSGEVRLLIANYGGPAQRVIFGVVEGGVAALGMPPPASYMRSGESRLLELDLPGGQDRQAVAVATCFDLRGRYAYAFAASGKQRRWRLQNPVTRGWNDISARDMFVSLYPDSPSPADLDVVGHRLIERQI